jgi:hypothetical protein
MQFIPSRGEPTGVLHSRNSIARFVVHVIHYLRAALGGIAREPRAV